MDLHETRDTILGPDASKFVTEVLREFAVELVVLICARILSVGPPKQTPMTLEALQYLWEDFGLHHKLMEHLDPTVDDLGPDEYAAALDEFEGEIHDRLEAAVGGRACERDET